MAVLALTAVGAAVGGAALPGGITLFGATLSGAAIGSAVGGLAGAALDQSLLAQTTKQSGPRLSDLRITASTEGAPVMRVYGRMRIGGQVIWASRFRETSDTETSGGKGGGGGQKVKTTTYSYSASFAVGLCEGVVEEIGRIWADGEPLAKGDYEIRLHRGAEDQLPDPKIVAVEGADFAPAYRGLAYLVFEELPLEAFGNRVPQITVEVIRRPPSVEPQLEDLVTAVTMIPGSSEFAYATDVVERSVGFGAWEAENAHVAGAGADMLVALDDLEALAPNAGHVSLVVAWHGTDLRAGHCEIRPEVEIRDKNTRPYAWRVGGLTRDEADLVSRRDGAPALGGAPADRAVYDAIREMKDRGLEVMLNPFLLMDIAPGNALPDPYGGAEQAAYPWRGRIVCHPAPGQPGSPDRTAAIDAQVAAFFGTAASNHFDWSGDERRVGYDGPEEWSYRRFVLHMATIARHAGADAFLIGSEMVGLTRLRAAGGGYPAVAALKDLAADVRAIVGPNVKIGYAADWTEYANHRPDDNSNDVIFHLDPLWADANIDFVGIDNYASLADWRDGAGHLDALAGWRGVNDLSYLDANIEGGEGYDWFYASPAARDAQIRTPIVDTAHGEHWLFRAKDFVGWWANAHHDRPGGARAETPTQWVPQSKPIWFCELGCPAVDRGANQPNVFVDAKSSESGLPHFSSGRRDDVGQRAALTAQLTHWADPENNPVSALTSAPMIDVARIYLWTWDARPHAVFPARSDVWKDADNWRLGHWLTGRLGLASLRDLVADIAGGLSVPLDLDDLEGLVRGYAPDRVMSAREAIEPLLDAYGATALARADAIRFSNRRETPVAELVREDLADLGESKPAFRLTRAQASEVPRILKLRYLDPDADYRQSAVDARRLAGEGKAVAEVSLALALDADEAQALADGMLIEASVARERGEWALPPSRLALEPGDLVRFSAHGRTMLMRLDSVGEEFARPVKATRADPDAREVERVVAERRPPGDPARAAAPVFEVLDLPLLTGDEPAHAPRLAAYGKPWTPVAVYRSENVESFLLDQVLASPATIGRLTAPLGAHPSGRFDRTNALEVEIGPDRVLESRAEEAVLAGGNVAAVRGASGAWEVLQFLDAELVGAGRWRLTGLLRGQAGTEDAIGADEGAAFVLIDQRTPPAGLGSGALGRLVTWRAGPATKPRNDATYVETAVPIGGRGLLPYAPVRLTAQRDAGTGDVTLEWTRRTRIGGDDFDIREVRLGEETEAYEISILSDGALVRTAETPSPRYVYAHVAQQEDFGGLPASLAFTVRQLSAEAGLGLPASAEIAL
ncbi:glycoside hydrolase/phage tail family protein [Hansschlegelia quercus]|uniref:Host specificity protein n=1 Tax=Hansschlegelia quercus TaxID=2528245 RepID=A0A4Q9GBL5_9HYPH|nr:glycoside hydrolase/phage tail family protein [Hansschlegelia quercus]TBN48677.1 hypothetical protein EYR15_13910 [Hansschlegelia quercus]